MPVRLWSVHNPCACYQLLISQLTSYNATAYSKQEESARMPGVGLCQLVSLLWLLLNRSQVHLSSAFSDPAALQVVADSRADMRLVEQSRVVASYSGDSTLHTPDSYHSDLETDIRQGTEASPCYMYFEVRVAHCSARATLCTSVPCSRN